MRFNWSAAWQRNLRGRLLFDLSWRLPLAGAAVGVFVVVFVTLPQVTSWPLIYTAHEWVVAGAMIILLGAFSGALAGAIVALVVAPLVFFARAPEDRARHVFVVTTIVAGFACGLFLIHSLTDWVGKVVHWPLSNFRSFVGAFVLSCAIATWIASRPSRREKAIAELESAFSSKATRRGVMGLSLGAAAAVVIEAPPLVFRPSPIMGPRAHGPNVLLVTFDAMSAEDVSAYGYPRQTTPSIDALARRSTLFTNYYSCSTFTTPSIASMISGRYPSSTRVIHVRDRLRGDAADKNLARILRAHGYTTASASQNPGAHMGRL